MSSDIRRFQTDKGLEVDGILNPKGPIISALNKHLVQTRKGSQYEDIGNVLGYGKELLDLVKKLPNHKKYGGVDAIIADGLKDIENNEKGLNLGRMNPDADCEKMVKNGKN